ncbi:MAG: Rab family GTPase [Thermoplasmata archaeon]
MTANKKPQLKEKKMKMKVCLIGEGAVGKTSLIRRFVHDDFDDKYLQTLGTKVSKKELEIPLETEGALIKVDMTVWDIMGQKGFRELLKDAYFYGAKGIIAVCDVTRRSTLEELDDWIEGVYSVSGKIPIQFLANKSDLEDEMAMNEEDLRQAAKAYDSPYYFTSAKTGQNVEKAFQELAYRIGKEKFHKETKKSQVNC